MSKDKAEKAEIERAKKARKTQEKADKDRAKTARKAQDKAERAQKDRVESARQSERARLFDEVLNQASTRSKTCCEPCNFHVKTDNGEYQPCKLGHKDSGPDKEICADCTDSRYHPKK
jgi:membrane protein involved in colicin uptake